MHASACRLECGSRGILGPVISCCCCCCCCQLVTCCRSGRAPGCIARLLPAGALFTAGKVAIVHRVAHISLQPCSLNRRCLQRVAIIRCKQNFLEPAEMLKADISGATLHGSLQREAHGCIPGCMVENLFADCDLASDGHGIRTGKIDRHSDANGSP